MSKKFLIVLIVCVFLVVIALVLLRGDEDVWLCQNNQWARHGNPSAEMPIEACGSEKIRVSQPQANEAISSPLKVTGKARGFWFFEASFPVKLVDGNGKEIAVAIAQAKSDWMTENFVDFEAELNFPMPETEFGKLIFQKDNPSGLAENDEQMEVPIQFSEFQAATMKVKVFFNNSQMDPEVSCNKVFPVEREIPKTSAVARAAIEELLKGVVEGEKSQGFFTSINSGVKIQKLTIENNVAKIDFDEQLEFQMGGSCRVSAIRAQIIETLKQFSSVKEVVISVNGRTEDILQP